MSLTSGFTNENEQAGEKLADHVATRVGADAPNVFASLLDAFAGYRIVIQLERK